MTILVQRAKEGKSHGTNYGTYQRNVGDDRRNAKADRKMTSEYISTFEEICTGSESQKEPEPVKEEKPVDRSKVRAKLAELTRLGFSDEVKALLQKHGAERLSAVDDAELPALMKRY